jgi:hypothetical protein
VEFANLFSHAITGLRTLELHNRTNRKKAFDENEIKSVHRFLPNLNSLRLNRAPLSDWTLQLLLPRLSALHTLCVSNTPTLTNDALLYIARYLPQLRLLELGGSATEYNQHFSYEGFEAFLASRAPLEVVRLEYCTRVGDQVIRLLANKFRTTLHELHIARNCFEKCAKISDKAIDHLKVVQRLERLSLCYSRKLRD